MDAADHAMAVVRVADRDRYLATLYAPEEKRTALFALYAFDAEVAQIRDRVREALAGEIRLQWWRDALADASGAAAAGSPVAEAMVAAMRAHDLPASAFDAYFDARIADLYDDPTPNRETLEAWCGATASTLIQLACLVLDPVAARGVTDLAGHAGCAQAIARLIQRLPQDRRRGRCLIPEDILAAAGSSREAVIAGDASARNAVTAMIALGTDHLGKFERGAVALPVSLRAAFLPLAVTTRLLAKLAGAADPLDRPAQVYDLARHWALFRHARRGWKVVG